MQKSPAEEQIQGAGAARDRSAEAEEPTLSEPGAIPRSGAQGLLVELADGPERQHSTVGNIGRN